MAEINYINGYEIADAAARQAIINTGTEINNEKLARQNADSLLQDQITNIVSGSPIPVSSTDDMTDTSKIYVLTTDGYWYYYDGDSWEQGGVYQATGISDDSIDKYMLNKNVKDSVYKDVGSRNLFADNYEITNFGSGGDKVTENAKFRSILIPCKGNTSYAISKMNSNTNRFLITTTEAYPVTGASISQREGETGLNAYLQTRFGYVTTGADDKYLYFLFYNTDDTSDSYTDLLASLECYEVENFTKEKTNSDSNKDSIDNVENTIENMIINTRGTKNLFNPYDLNQYENILPSSSTTKYALNSCPCSIVFPLEPNTTYTVKRSVISPRFGYSLCNEYPFSGFIDYYNKTENNSGDTLTINNTTYKYAVIRFYYDTAHEDVDYLTRAKDIIIFKGTEYVENSYVFGNLLDPKYLNLVKYRPLGTLQKSYIAISCDDGKNALSDITIPLFQGYKVTYGKNIPITMGLMHNSEIFADATRLQTVANFIGDTGSSVAIHGSTSYTSYTQAQLFDFLDTEKEYITNNLVAPTSIIYPNHDYNDLSATIAGSYYGVCCTGGVNNPISYGGNDIRVAGPRSNMYTIYRFSLFNAQMTTQKIKNAIDYAYEHNMIFTPFFHDVNLTTDYDRCKALLDYCVDYANSKGLTFINVGDIPNIT